MVSTPAFFKGICCIVFAQSKQGIRVSMMLLLMIPSGY